MSYAIAGVAIVARPYLNASQINQFAYKLTGADVMSWKPKSRLQQLWERLLQVVSQEGKP
ncbi:MULTISPECIES: hypothetical protein [Pantoea]|jgi:hypothetical protein|uniref:Uncharacterized protein n=2 Tax=root TaxID=1 RepID=A0A7Y6TSZ4_9GAMM|nr:MULTISPECIES: hypothetical protein [Pantoea]DAE23052.1 MAG TPA: Lambda Phage CIII [Siphoviridae sp. ct2u94]MBS6035844.1 hypothetical protein [Pantoea sp.]MBZ6396579.1 hypothetical protein [Pantoea sp.]MBZ6438346.1 hypothetical protein [Pantoea sp.]NUY42810.1 hypothetical protein [Pantoea brenneri]